MTRDEAVRMLQSWPGTCSRCSKPWAGHFTSYTQDEFGNWPVHCGEPTFARADTAALTAEANARGEGFKADAMKDRWDLLPWNGVKNVVKVLTLGAKKYAEHNWQKVPEARSRYFAAAQRHIVAWAQGEELDPESKLPHLAHAICCLLFLNWFDERRDS